MKRIEIIVDTEGNSQVETKGFSGSECVNASKLIETALGKQTSYVNTTEFYQGQQNQQNIVAEQ